MQVTMEIKIAMYLILLKMLTDRWLN